MSFDSFGTNSAKSNQMFYLMELDDVFCFHLDLLNNHFCSFNSKCHLIITFVCIKFQCICTMRFTWTKLLEALTWNVNTLLTINQVHLVLLRLLMRMVGRWHARERRALYRAVPGNKQNAKEGMLQCNAQVIKSTKLFGKWDLLEYNVSTIDFHFYTVSPYLKAYRCICLSKYRFIVQFYFPCYQPLL